MKVIIPVAGLGTRMLPATKAIPKEMLPVVDKPLIQHVVQEAADAGATEIVLVTHASKNSIENHFDTSFELEATLEKRVKRQLLEDVKNICPKGVKIISVRQGEPKGLGHAILCALPVVGHESFAVILPDVLMNTYTSNSRKDNLAEMIKNFEKTNTSQIMVEEVPIDKTDQYSIASVINPKVSAGGTTPIRDLIEKPEPQESPSNLAVVGRYVLHRDIWNHLKKTPPGNGNEIQLTDAIDMMLEDKRKVSAYKIVGQSIDCGSKIGLMKAQVLFGLNHAEIGKEFTQFIKKLPL
ncbi:MAG: UTP--glucose-1-phosphate uridylyltransferase GalU [Planctomycetes bacterium]|nr:UTP--glucose-1-phosphate uridylyltransferase GalU [Planctomycetota bacterium]